MKIKYFTLSILSVVLTSLLCQYFNNIGLETWYGQLNKPIITPPSYVFAIVWNILYAILAFCFYIVLNTKRPNKKAIKLYLLQLILQISWCAAFFALHSFILGLIILAIINFYSRKMTLAFAKINEKTFYLLLPYNIWILFALLLNLTFYIVN